jgi:hypothetical protein
MKPIEPQDEPSWLMGEIFKFGITRYYRRKTSKQMKRIRIILQSSLRSIKIKEKRITDLNFFNSEE